jgi:hypothetical protein
MPQKTVFQSMELFAKGVMPYFREADAVPGAAARAK